MSRPSQSAALRISVSDRSLRVSHPTRGVIEATARIVHTVPHWPSAFFGHSAFLYFGTVHEYRVLLTAQELAWGADEPGAGEGRKRYLADKPKAVEKLWHPLARLGEVAPPSRRLYTASRLLVARVQLQEIPYRLVEEMNPSFAEAFRDDEERDEFEVVDRLRGVDDGITLRRPLQTGGSLLIIRGFEVHPAFAGQRIGARTLFHAVWELARHPDDLIYFGAYPVRTIFTRGGTSQGVTPGALTGIVRYYMRLGFHRAEPDAVLSGDTHARLYRHIGAFGLPVDGLGILSEQAGRARVEPIDLE
jgi:GNAT superfamily N-acetyltransferase